MNGGPEQNLPAGEPAPVLVGGTWRMSLGTDTFVKRAPAGGAPLGMYPVSPWAELDEALEHARTAFDQLVSMGDAAAPAVATFLERYAERLHQAEEELVRVAHLETALPVSPRLAAVELPRTVGQLRQAAASARDRSWTLPTLSTTDGIASYFAPIPGVVAVFGPNNFPFAFNSVAGGDFAAAVATCHPVIAKANPGHPETTRILAREAHAAASEVELPDGFVQMIYRTTHADGARLVADSRIAASAYTGSQAGGLALKGPADAAGKPIYLEMSSINPVLVLPGALRERGEMIAEELAASALSAAGQFCTSPGLIILPEGPSGDAFVARLGKALASSPSGTLLDDSGREGLAAAVAAWEQAGAVVVERATEAPGWCIYPNTLMSVSGDAMLAAPRELQTEAFGPVVLAVRVSGSNQLNDVVSRLDGNLTGCIYSATDGSDENDYNEVAPMLRQKVGRLLNDKVPTGVAVVAAMNHGGPYPSTGHPGFSAVGVPVSLRRFAMLQCFDAVRPHRLPLELRPDNPLAIVRLVDGQWTREISR